MQTTTASRTASKYTEEEKKAYFASLRVRWTAAKTRSESSDVKESEKFRLASALTPNLSVAGYCYVLEQMEVLGLEGVPGIDARTFVGWKAAGFMVRKGETSRMSGITWISSDAKTGADGKKEEGFTFPKEYHLFHRSQVEAIDA